MNSLPHQDLRNMIHCNVMEALSLLHRNRRIIAYPWIRLTVSPLSGIKFSLQQGIGCPVVLRMPQSTGKLLIPQGSWCVLWDEFDMWQRVYNDCSIRLRARFKQNMPGSLRQTNDDLRYLFIVNYVKSQRLRAWK